MLIHDGDDDDEEDDDDDDAKLIRKGQSHQNHQIMLNENQE